jgi:hypothetical protein
MVIHPRTQYLFPTVRPSRPGWPACVLIIERVRERLPCALWRTSRPTGARPIDFFQYLRKARQTRD